MSSPPQPQSKPSAAHEAEHFQDRVPHVSGDDGAADIFHSAFDVEEPPTKAEAAGPHETLEHSKRRVHMEGKTDVEILKDEGADLPHHTHAGKVDLPGAAD